ncbi:glycogen/starch synthase, ADP-glucose type [Desulfofarcimen acetoxidans DSM 771]|jgi:starch synthase|uniref:Glycogen synthase n=1 Tax=Desulfofarcimen acetoxidans (strain ATCC 49208 / DSM 771 / KCTC 5769 / VKM B-1644 / 5575) TaxID=485916 RepID=C8W265_DESAS|nr:glycogen synthase GlgA [Desulfofarcimen acetoxidans]ACV61729.1 glycogen/starch synthase, ADP-glucose type [Desulfofarcimen acetoxidans DSM 771]
MKVLFVAGEAFPFAKTGGLADVVGSLPKYLRKLGVDVRVMIPKYGDIQDIYTEDAVTVHSRIVDVGWRHQYCGIQEVNYQGVPIYFVDNEYYFKRQGYYGFYDEAERYAFFCRAVLDCLPHIHFIPQIIHCHDWHAGMVSALIKTQYRYNAICGRLKTIFTVHNLKYQGIFPHGILWDLFRLSYEHFNAEGLEFYGDVSYLKAGLVYSDIITTVSQNYMYEIQTPFYGERLDGLLRRRSHELYGIINGIDYEEYNPLTDPHIFVNYNADSLDKKLQNKASLQQYLGLPERPEIPLIAIVSRLVGQKGLDLVARVLGEMLDLDVQLVVLGTGEAIYENMFRNAAYWFPQKVSANIYFDNSLAHRVYAGSDMLLVPSLFEPCGLSQLIAMRYGCLPVARETGGLKDTVLSYNENTGEGNGFSFANYNAHDMLYTVSRAVGFYKQQEVWQKIVRQSMSMDYSWDTSAQEYAKLYNILAKRAQVGR